MNQPLAETIFWIAAVACVIAELAILRSTFAARSANKSDLVPSASRRSEIAWAIIPALALVVVLSATRQRMETRDRHLRIDHSEMDHSEMQHSMPMPAPPSAPRH